MIRHTTKKHVNSISRSGTQTHTHNHLLLLMSKALLSTANRKPNIDKCFPMNYQNYFCIKQIEAKTKTTYRLNTFTNRSKSTKIR